VLTFILTDIPRAGSPLAALWARLGAQVLSASYAANTSSLLPGKGPKQGLSPHPSLVPDVWNCKRGERVAVPQELACTPAAFLKPILGALWDVSRSCCLSAFRFPTPHGVQGPLELRDPAEALS